MTECFITSGSDTRMNLRDLAKQHRKGKKIQCVSLCVRMNK